MKYLLAILALLMLVIGACSPATTPTPLPPTSEATTEDSPTDTAEATADAEAAEATADTAQTSATGDEPLRIAALPVINSLPLHVAAEEGFYEDEGVSVELVPFGSAREREAAMQAGAIDGENTDLISAILLSNAGVGVRAVRLDPPATPFFSIVVGAESGIETVEDLKGVEIAVSSNTVIEYLTVQLLREQSFTDEDIRLIEVSSIPQRLEFLANGQVKAATLPEPLTTLATAQGGRVILNDADTGFVPTVLAFSQQALDERPDDVRAFLRAYERAVEAINENPNQYRDLFIASAGIPENLQETYEVPPFLEASVLSEEQVQAVMDWMVERDLIEQALPYDQVMTGDFLP